MKKVLAFGAFDPLHQGHISFLQQAKSLGDYLTVVVARDSAIRSLKGYEPYEPEEERLRKIAQLESVDKAILGNKTAHHFRMLGEEEFDVLALGYDQHPSDEEVRKALKEKKKFNVEIVRLKPFHPEKYKSTFIRRQNTDPNFY